jgi:hypothetical protein
VGSSDIWWYNLGIRAALPTRCAREAAARATAPTFTWRSIYESRLIAWRERQKAAGARVTVYGPSDECEGGAVFGAMLDFVEELSRCRCGAASFLLLSYIVGRLDNQPIRNNDFHNRPCEA